MLEEYYKSADQPFGPAENAFGTAQDNLKNPQNDHAVMIENIDRDNIVTPDGFADLILPKRELLMEHGLHSFLAFNEENFHILDDMLQLAIREHGEENNTLFFNVLPKAVRPADAGDNYFTLMSVAYVHLWSVQTSEMKRTNEDFFRDAQQPSEIELPEDLQNYKTFAPIDIQFKEKPLLELFKNARAMLAQFESSKNLRPLIDKGSRLMARMGSNGWTVHILTGARLSAISKAHD